MQEVLQQVNTVPDVLGSLVCSDNGTILAHAFPALYDLSTLQQAAAHLAGEAGKLQVKDGSVEILDFRYGDGRIVIRPLLGAFLLLLCAKSVNIQLLAISLKVAEKKIEPHITVAVSTGKDDLPSGAREKSATVARGFQLEACRLLNDESRRSFEQFGMVALTQTTASQMGTLFGVGSFKKIRLAGPGGGKGGTFAVMIVNENDTFYDGKAILSASIEKKLNVTAGDLLKAELDSAG